MGTGCLIIAMGLADLLFGPMPGWPSPGWAGWLAVPLGLAICIQSVRVLRRDKEKPEKCSDEDQDEDEDEDEDEAETDK
jgi:hypothetical protein